jgi:hypothetical protein
MLSGKSFAETRFFHPGAWLVEENIGTAIPILMETKIANAGYSARGEH